jgi:hypothetical protein
MTFFDVNASSLKNEVYSTNLSSSNPTSSDDEGMIHDENLPPSKKAEFDPIKNLFQNICSFVHPAVFRAPDLSLKRSSESTQTSSSDLTDSDSAQEIFYQKHRGVKRRHPAMEASDSTLQAYHSDSETKMDNHNRTRRRVRRRINVGNPSTPVSQYKINHICSCLLRCNIKTRKDLINHFADVVGEINQNSKIFKSHFTEEQCFTIFKEALEVYNQANYLRIVFTEADVGSRGFKRPVITAAMLPNTDDLLKVTRSYDRLAKSNNTKKQVSSKIEKILGEKNHVVCPNVILGAGDSAISIWLQKFESHHGRVTEKLTADQLPEILMIGRDSGCWIQDYTLAQPHNLLERENSKWNPGDFIATSTYQENPQTNGRHVYQANQIILAKTEAPLLITSVTSIEKKNQKSSNWIESEYNYRLLIDTASGGKYIYTNEIDICTGLGPARNPLVDTVISQTDFTRLNQFDEKKKFTPIVDGNQFVLSDSEEKSKKARTIVVYGGGGTAAACYRKGFFGHDNKVDSLEFNNENKKNSVLWIARNFDKAGGGKLATTALSSAKQRNELITGELKEITHDPINGNLKLRFEETNNATKEINTFEVVCDQLVYSTGQDDLKTRQVLKELESDIELDFDETGMPLGVKTKDSKVHYHGAAAMAVREKEYLTSTWNWLKRENIGPDVGPGSMPPSRAQIKRYMERKGVEVGSVNVNTDSSHLIKDYILHLRINESTADSLVNEIIELRKQSTSGFSRQILSSLLDKYDLHEIVEIYGHGQLRANTKTKGSAF